MVFGGSLLFLVLFGGFWWVLVVLGIFFYGFKWFLVVFEVFGGF